MEFLALGDSYTIGELVQEAERWPVQLAAALQANGIAVSNPRIIAKSGWTTDELNTAIDENRPKSDYHLVTLLIGVNNQYRGRSVDDYKPEFDALLNRAIEFAGGKAERVIVVSIPDYGLTPFIRERDRDPKQIAIELDDYNQTAQTITKQVGAHWVDITSISRRHGGEEAMLAEDGLHPSGEMYRLWTKEILPVAQRILSNK